MMVEEFLNWLHEEGKDEKTIKAYRSCLNQFIEWLHGNDSYDMSAIKPIDIKEYNSYLKHNLNRSPNTINKSTAALKTYFSYLTENNHIAVDPTKKVKLIKIQQIETVKDTMKWLTKREQERFISYVDEERNELERVRNLAIIDVMLYAGLRVAEVEDLKIEDIKVNGDITITIREGKKGKYAVVTLINDYSRNLRKWLRMRQTLDKSKHKESPYLFVSERSGQFGARGIQAMLNKYAELAGMENITPHRFRHSFCKNLALAGIPIEIISKLARHENIQTTAIYIDSTQQEMLSALKKM
ncbi:tyrosine-type recombinase/integrase [Paenibacillus elgii]|uniref:tyrosine-type recombinase/integrase n=1 Tax=Paenibacillus elgii TaxID=189691 RepID=UPI00203BC451|nr:tyrosine-type recombinase/integrase [Paenibacillus elgii]MCM3271136.1 tyrosine-type recombinase/integrase [Paenibacillus elgii]